MNFVVDIALPYEDFRIQPETVFSKVLFTMEIRFKISEPASFSKNNFNYLYLIRYGSKLKYKVIEKIFPLEISGKLKPLFQDYYYYMWLFKIL